LVALATTLPEHQSNFLGYSVSVVSVFMGQAKAGEQTERLSAAIAAAKNTIDGSGKKGGT